MKFNGQDPYDALAAIFLGDPPPTETGAVTSTPRRHEAAAGSRSSRSSSLSLGERPRASLLRVTAAVTGHLPVMAGLWATQFADRVGAVDGPTGLIRCERELVHAEILRSGGRHIGLRQEESFDAWLARAVRLVRRWIICLPDNGDPAQLFDRGFADRVLLTSADEAAVAAAQRVISWISAAAGANGTSAALGLVVVGAPPERVSWMLDELAMAHRGALDLPLAGTIQRMDRVDSSERYGFDVTTAPSVESLLRIMEEAAERAVDRLDDGTMHEARRPPSASARREPRAVAEAQRDDCSTKPAEPVVWREATASLADALEHHAEVVVPSVGRRHAAAPVAAPGSACDAVPGSAPVTDLTPHLTGLASLTMRCPSARAVELASDPLGRLHLVVAHADMSSLRTARAWAITNEELLLRAFPALASSGAPFADRIVDRIVTLDAAAVESLYGAGMALDLLVEVRLGASTAFHHVPLNALARVAAQGA